MILGSIARIPKRLVHIQCGILVITQGSPGQVLITRIPYGVIVVAITCLSPTKLVRLY